MPTSRGLCKSHIGRQFKSKIKEKGLNLEDLAIQINYSVSDIKDILKGGKCCEDLYYKLGPILGFTEQEIHTIIDKSHRKFKELQLDLLMESRAVLLKHFKSRKTDPDFLMEYTDLFGIKNIPPHVYQPLDAVALKIHTNPAIDEIKTKYNISQHVARRLLNHYGRTTALENGKECLKEMGIVVEEKVKLEITYDKTMSMDLGNIDNAQQTTLV